MRTPLKKRLLNLCLLAVAIGVSLLLCEFVVRLLYGDTTVLFPRHHTSAKYGDYTIRRLRPDIEFRHRSAGGSWRFRTNRQGFRNDRDFRYEKPEDVVRVITLGDSHTQGFEARQDSSYSAIAERYLRRRGRNAEVYNTGVSGFSTAEQLVYLENEGVRYKPDFVVLGFFANDFKDNIRTGLFAVGENGLEEKAHEYTPGVRAQDLVYRLPFTQFLSENSYLYSILFNTVWVQARRQLTSQRKAAVIEERAVRTEDLDAYKIELTGLLIERLYAFCREHGITLIVLDIPEQSDTDFMFFQSSFPDEMLAQVRDNSDAFLYTEDVLGEFHDLVQVHVPGGHRHISEFTHAVLGAAIGKEIMAILDERSKHATPTTEESAASE